MLKNFSTCCEKASAARTSSDETRILHQTIAVVSVASRKHGRRLAHRVREAHLHRDKVRVNCDNTNVLFYLLHRRRSFSSSSPPPHASRVACRGSAKVSGPKITVTNPPYTEVFERGYPPRETVPAFFQSKMNWIVREDARGCKFLHKVRAK